MPLSSRNVRAPLSAAVCALVLGAWAAGPAAAGETARASTSVFSGSDYKEDSSFTYIGAVHALNGDLDRDGFLLRVFGGFGEYEYDTTAVARGHVDTDLVLVDVGIGYQTINGGIRYSAYASASYEDHDQSPVDFSNPVRDEEWGFKGQAEVETTAGAPIYFGAIGSYSTGFESYWVRGRIGANIGHGLVLGPEIIGLGNEGFDQIRYGAFLGGLPTLWSLLMGGDSKMTIAVGYADTDEDGGAGTGQGGDDSVYGSMSSSFRF